MPRVSDGKILEQLLRSAASADGGKVPDIATPQSSLYGVFGQNYGAALQGQAANDPYFGPVAMMRLNDMRQAEMDAYEQQLEASREAQLAAQATGANADLDKTIIENSPKDLYNVFNRGTSPTTGGYGGLVVDPVLSSAANAVELDSKIAESQGTRATAIKNTADAGFAPAPADVGAYLRSPLENPDSAIKYGVYMTPADATKRYEADEGMTVSQQFSMQELKNAGALEIAMAGAQARNGKWKAVINPDDGTVSYQFTGTPEELSAQGLSPPGGAASTIDPGIAAMLQGLGFAVPNPNADAQAPGASATQGSDPAKFFSNPSSKQGIRNDPLGKGKRMHNGVDYPKPLGTPIPAEKDGTVVAVGPKQGFGGNVVTIRYDDGEEVFYGHNRRATVQPGQRVARGQVIGEVGSEGRSTGPHVHKQVVARREPQSPKVAGTRTNKITAIMTNAQNKGMDIKLVGDRVFITSSDGSQTRIYDVNGNRLK